MNITSDGTYLLNNSGITSATSSIIYLSGTISSSAVELHYKDEDDTAVAYTDGVLTALTAYKLDHGIGVEVFAVVTSSDGSTDINISRVDA